MKTLKNLVIASTVALALSFSGTTNADSNYELGFSVYSVAEGDQVPVSEIPDPIEAFYVNDVVYLHSTGLSETFTLHIFADAEIVEVKGGNVTITVDQWSYIYPIGDNATIISFLESL